MDDWLDRSQIPVDPAGDLLDGVSGIADGIKTAEDAAHARAGDIVDLQPGGIDGFENADMGQSFCAAAAEDKADLRRTPVVAGLRRRRRGGLESRK